MSENALYGGMVEGYQLTLGDVVLPEDPHKVESLLCLLHQFCGVHAPGQVLLSANSEKTEVFHLLYTLPANEWAECPFC